MRNYSFLNVALAACIMITTAACGTDSDDIAKTGADTNLSTSTPAGEVVAKVNGQAINKRQLDRSMVALAQNQQQKKMPPQPKPLMEKEALMRLIQLELLYQESQSKNLIPNDEEVNQTLTQMKSRLPNEEAFKQLLAQSFSSEEEFRKDISRNLSIKRLIDQEILPTVEVTEEESSAFYEENKEKMKQPESVRVRHILAKLEKTASAEEESAAKQKIEKIIERANKGEDFADLARNNSEGPSAKSGGDLGFFARGRMVPEFDKVAFALEKPGQISEIVKTPFGFHVLKLEEKRAERTVPFEEAQQSISQLLKNQKMNGAIKGFVDNLYKKAQIESQFDLGESPVKTP